MLPQYTQRSGMAKGSFNHLSHVPGLHRRAFHQKQVFSLSGYMRCAYSWPLSPHWGPPFLHCLAGDFCCQGILIPNQGQKWIVSTLHFIRCEWCTLLSQMRGDRSTPALIISDAVAWAWTHRDQWGQLSQAQTFGSLRKLACLPHIPVPTHLQRLLSLVWADTI